MAGLGWLNFSRNLAPTFLHNPVHQSSCKFRCQIGFSREMQLTDLIWPPLQRSRCDLMRENCLSSSRQRPQRNRLWPERKPRSEMGRGVPLSAASGHRCEWSSSSSLKMQEFGFKRVKLRNTGWQFNSIFWPEKWPYNWPKNWPMMTFE